MKYVALMSIHRGRDASGAAKVVEAGTVFSVNGDELDHLLANDAVREATDEEVSIAEAKKPVTAEERAAAERKAAADAEVEAHIKTAAEAEAKQKAGAEAQAKADAEAAAADPEDAPEPTGNPVSKIVMETDASAQDEPASAPKKSAKSAKAAAKADASDDIDI